MESGDETRKVRADNAVRSSPIIYSLYGFWEEGGKGKALRHVSSDVLLFLLVEAEVDPGGECPGHCQPGESEGNH